MTETAITNPFIGVALKRTGDVVDLQPFHSTGEYVETLKIDLRTGTAETSTQPRFLRNCIVFPGLLGMLRLAKATVLVTIKEAKQVHSFAHADRTATALVLQVATVHGSPVYRVVQTELHLPRGRLSSEDAKCVHRCINA